MSHQVSLAHALALIEQQRHAITILELEKAQYKLRAKILGKKLSWLESQKKKGVSHE